MDQQNKNPTTDTAENGDHESNDSTSAAERPSDDHNEEDPGFADPDPEAPIEELLDYTRNLRAYYGDEGDCPSALGQTPSS